MAGIGFELKKLFVGSGVIRKMRAYAYAAVICSGTMILAILLLLAVQTEARFFGVSEHMREVLVVTILTVLPALLLAFALVSCGGETQALRYRKADPSPANPLVGNAVWYGLALIP
ncbi:MAG: hypothetical protein IKX19_11030 [Clostridia bacterium]|nr:hypothetical protein [Clostridia bacterium]